MQPQPVVKSTSSTVIVLVVTVCIITVISQLFTLSSVYGYGYGHGYGYGYGYGFGHCTPIGPKNLATTFFPTARRLRITWQAAIFSACGSSTDHYKLFIWQSGVLIHHETISAANTATAVRYNQLAGVGRYRYQIIAYSKDGGVLVSDDSYFTLR